MLQLPQAQRGSAGNHTNRLRGGLGSSISNITSDTLRSTLVGHGRTREGSWPHANRADDHTSECLVIELPDGFQKWVMEKLEADLRTYATNRQKDVARGLETNELAALLVEKYGYGAMAAAKAIFDVLEQPAPDLYPLIDELVASIDAEYEHTRNARRAARPAGLTFPAVD